MGRILRQLLLLLLVISCMVSALVSGRFTARLILDGAVSFAFVPIVELLGFACVWKLYGRNQELKQTAGIFLAGNLPWLLWCLVITAIGCFVAPAQMDRLSGTLRNVFIYGSAGLVALWSAWMDLKYFREVLHSTERDAMKCVFAQRLISWGSGAVYFYSFAIPPFLLRIVS